MRCNTVPSHEERHHPEDEDADRVQDESSSYIATMLPRARSQSVQGLHMQGISRSPAAYTRPIVYADLPDVLNPIRIWFTWTGLYPGISVRATSVAVSAQRFRVQGLPAGSRSVISHVPLWNLPPDENTRTARSAILTRAWKYSDAPTYLPSSREKM